VTGAACAANLVSREESTPRQWIRCFALLLLLAACGFAGKLRGPWLEAVAQIVAGEEERRGHALLNQKYWPWKSIGDVFSRLRGRRQVILVLRLQ
jgi:hypothetical protein